MQCKNLVKVKKQYGDDYICKARGTAYCIFYSLSVCHIKEQDCAYFENGEISNGINAMV